MRQERSEHENEEDEKAGEVDTVAEAPEQEDIDEEVHNDLDERRGDKPGPHRTRGVGDRSKYY